MKLPQIIPVILSGGSGTRLWPLSRASKPKQFLSFGGGPTLIQQTALRCQGEGFDPRPIFVAAEAHRFLVAEDAVEIGVEADIILEPMRRDSCAAIVAGALQAHARNDQALILVLAADHHIPDIAQFQKAVRAAAPAALEGSLVTFGIRPKSPHTGYGYILPGAPVGAGPVVKVSRFVEKPDLKTAEAYVAQGYLWNSGNFLFKASVFLDEARQLVPGMVQAVEASLRHAQRDLSFLRLSADDFARAPQISVDFAIMEKTARAAVLPVDYAWSDIGSWEAVAKSGTADADGNVVVGRGVAEASHNVMIHSERKLTAVLGLDDVVVVSTRDAILVAAKSATEKVKDLVAHLKALGHREAEDSHMQYRPWGHREMLDEGEGYLVRRIHVLPGGVISRQSHADRAEHWIVVQGEAAAVVDGQVHHLKHNQSLMVPAGTVHQVSNEGSTSLILIEVHTGARLDEGDVKRF
jgi:mannose-1-phosphate guanylyltransferase / mannose-6-phosphate isomerase